MNRNIRTAFISVVLLFCAVSMPAQKLPLTAGQNQGAEVAPRPYDPLNRETPRGTVLGFLDAVHKDDYATASLYLQLPPGKSKNSSHDLARQLGVLMDLKYQGRSVSLSDQPEGVLTDNLAPNMEKIGRIPTEDGSIDVMLIRSESPTGTPIWLFSREVVERVPELYSQVEMPIVARLMPSALASHKFLSLSWGQWIGWLLSIPVAVLIAAIILTLVRLPGWSYRRFKHRVDNRIWKERYSRPVLLLVSIVANGFLTTLLGIPLPHRGYYFRVLTVVFLLGVGWLAVRMIETSFERVRSRAVASGYVSTGSYLILMQRLARIGAMIIVALLIFGALGFETKTALAGLGIGGLAIALAAQKTLENLLGGVSLLVDNVVRVGDVCRIGNQVGTVLDLGLRSMSIRTVEQTIISVPNGMLASQQFENFTGRTKFLMKSIFQLQHGTSVERLQSVLNDIRQLLTNHEKIERESARVRFVNIGESSLDLELFAYVITRDNNEYLAVQEEVFFQIMRIIEANESGFAYPVRRMIVQQRPEAEQRVLANPAD